MINTSYGSNLVPVDWRYLVHLGSAGDSEKASKASRQTFFFF